MILFNDQEIKFGHFPNGEVNIPKPFFSEHKQAINKVTLKYEGDEDLLRLFLVRKALWFPADLHITYFPYSRMDRNSDEYIFTLKSITKLINLMEWNKVVVYEPHSDVTPALLNKCQVVNVTEHLFKEYLHLPGSQIFFPDAGAQKRYESLESPDSLVGFKKRDFATGRILSLEILGNKTSDTVIIVDDLCSKGGTFVLAAEKLHDLGFRNIVLVVAHCENTIFEGKIFSGSTYINWVMTTDSIIDNNRGYEKLVIVPLKDIKTDRSTEWRAKMDAIREKAHA